MWKCKLCKCVKLTPDNKFNWYRISHTKLLVLTDMLNNKLTSCAPMVHFKMPIKESSKQQRTYNLRLKRGNRLLYYSRLHIQWDIKLKVPKHISVEHVLKFEFPTCYVRRVPVSGRDKSLLARVEGVSPRITWVYIYLFT